jgi:hypothetical protein
MARAERERKQLEIKGGIIAALKELGAEPSVPSIREKLWAEVYAAAASSNDTIFSTPEQQANYALTIFDARFSNQAQKTK